MQVGRIRPSGSSRAMVLEFATAEVTKSSADGLKSASEGEAKRIAELQQRRLRGKPGGVLVKAIRWTWATSGVATSDEFLRQRRSIQHQRTRKGEDDA
jgi:hypothetical protein